ncbi:MAG TPA: phospholipase D-like domain-containing protein [Bacteroidia bacterium]|jgi:hypothetical protein|nr:phospholipase D-like domain-containing protein [Bacteroidia bacterium]
MDKKNPPIVIGVLRTKTFLKVSLLAVLFTFVFSAGAQNPKIKCYFNHPVNTAVSTGTNAIYLNGTSADTIAAYINRAKYTVDIAQYDFTASSSSHVKIIATAVNNANTRGVVVRWIYNGSSSNSGLSLVNSAINRLASPVSSGYIMHDKFMVVDANSSNANDAILWTGSYDWSDQQATGDYNNMVIVQDQNVALAYYNEFNKMWGGTGASPVTANEKFGTAKSVSTTTSFTVNGTPVQVYFSPKDSPQSHLLNTINSANYEFAFGIYTFTDNTVATAIKTKYTGGVAGFGIEDQFSNTYTPYTTLSSSMGANFKVYTGTSIYHNKTMIVDHSHPTSDPQVFTGSYNWSSAGANTNDEGTIVIHDATIANQYYQSLCKNFTDVGGSAGVCPATTGIDNYDYAQQQVAVYPNPSKDFVNVKVKNASEKLKVTLSNSLGEIVMDKNVEGNDETSFDISTLSPGLYFITVFRGDKTFAEKLLKP